MIEERPDHPGLSEHFCAALEMKNTEDLVGRSQIRLGPFVSVCLMGCGVGAAKEELGGHGALRCPGEKPLPMRLPRLVVSGGTSLCPAVPADPQTWRKQPHCGRSFPEISPMREESLSSRVLADVLGPQVVSARPAVALRI